MAEMLQLAHVPDKLRRKLRVRGAARGLTAARKNKRRARTLAVREPPLPPSPPGQNDSSHRTGTYRPLAILRGGGLFFLAAFATPAARMENLDEWRKIAAAGSPDMTTEQFVEHLHEADVPCGPVLTPEQAVESEQILANEVLVTSEHPVLGKIREPCPAARFEATPSKLERHAPALGENTDEVLAELGRTETEISDLRKAGSVG